MDNTPTHLIILDQSGQRQVAYLAEVSSVKMVWQDVTNSDNKHIGHDAVEGISRALHLAGDIYALVAKA